MYMNVVFFSLQIYKVDTLAYVVDQNFITSP